MSRPARLPVTRKWPLVLRSSGRLIFAVSSAPQIFVSSIWRQFSNSPASVPIWVAPSPALAKTASSPPKRSTAAVTARDTESGSLTSQATASALSPISPTSASSLSWRRAVSTTFQPASAAIRAVAAPIPLEAPVIISVFAISASPLFRMLRRM